MKQPKISVIGAGHVGATTAHVLAMKNLGDVVMLARTHGRPQGVGLDMLESSGVERFSSKVKGTNDYKDTADSDIVVITAGSPRKPGMSRDDLLEINAKAVRSITREVKKTSPNAILIVVTNPVDAMVHVAYRTSRFPKHRVMGMAGVLDTARMKTFIALETGYDVEDINALVLGGHGDDMVPLMRHANIGGVPVSELLPKSKINAIVKRTQKGGGEIVALLKEGSAYYAPASAIAAMVEAIVKDQKRILPCACFLTGQYGAKNIFMGVPAVLGSKGVEKIIELKLNTDEKKMLRETIKRVTKLTKSL